MRLLDSLRFRIATLFQRSHMNAEIEEELRSHIQERADDLERSGLRESLRHLARQVISKCNTGAVETLEM